MELTHFSLCSGIGGIDLAAEWAGFKTIGQCETDEYASKVLAKNFKGVRNFGDIRTITNERLAGAGIDTGAITLLSAGFPCQPYSFAGKGLGDRDERDLWDEVARIIGEIQPQWFVGENTQGLYSRQNNRYLRRVLDSLTSLGYAVAWGIWGACDVGAPHQRKRVFIVAYRSCERLLPHEIQGRKSFQNCGEASYGEIHASRSKFGGVCDVLSDAAGNELGLHRSKKEIKTVERLG